MTSKPKQVQLRFLFLATILAVICAGCPGPDSKADYMQNGNVAEIESEPIVGPDRKGDQSAAIDRFIEQTYRGWSLKGVSSKSGTFDCVEGELCNLHLEKKGGKSKIVTVILQEFVDANANRYFHVYEARDIDRARVRN